MSHTDRCWLTPFGGPSARNSVFTVTTRITLSAFVAAPPGTSSRGHFAGGGPGPADPG